MTIDTKDLLNSILSSISRIDYIRPNEIPNIDLYMDQVTTFMEEQLKTDQTVRGGQDPDQNHDQQLRQEQSASSPCEKEIFQRACAGDDLYLLFQKYPFHQGY